MALVDLKTDLKSLRYGKDRVGGGSSRQPFVRKPIPNSLFGTNQTGGSAFIIRGGTLALESTADDTSRLTQLLKTPSTSAGFLFADKQKQLGKTNVQTQASPLGFNAGKYSIENTLNQVANNYKGEHYLKQDFGDQTYYSVVKNLTLEENRLVGLTDTLITPKSNSVNVLQYPNGPGSSRGNGSTDIKFADQRTGVNNTDYNRYVTVVSDPKSKARYLQYSNGRTTQTELNYINLVSKGSNSISNRINGGDFQSITGLGRTLDTDNYTPVNALAKTSYSTVIKPNSTDIQTGTRNLGVNPSLTTEHSFYVQAGKDQNQFFFTPAAEAYNKTAPSQQIRSNINPEGINLDIKRVYDANLKYSSDNPKNLLTRKQIDSRTLAKDLGETPPADFRKLTNNSGPAPETRAFNLNKTFKVGVPGYKGIDRNIDPTRARKSVGTDEITYKKLGTQATPMADLIPFYIKIYENDSATPTLIQFRAFIKGVSDSFSADWTGNKMMGRGENFYTYNGFERSFSLSFDVHAQSRVELPRMYEKLNRLASATAPDYSQQGFMRGVFIELTVGDWMRAVPGKLNSIGYSVPDNSPWEIERNNVGVNTFGKNKLPHLVNVDTFDFTPIHNFLPAYKGQFIGAKSLI